MIFWSVHLDWSSHQRVSHCILLVGLSQKIEDDLLWVGLSDLDDIFSTMCAFIVSAFGNPIFPSTLKTISNTFSFGGSFVVQLTHFLFT